MVRTGDGCESVSELSLTSMGSAPMLRQPLAEAVLRCLSGKLLNELYFLQRVLTFNVLVPTGSLVRMDLLL